MVVLVPGSVTPGRKLFSLSYVSLFGPSWLTLVQTVIDICDSGRSSRSFFWVSNEVFDAFSLLESIS